MDAVKYSFKWGKFSISARQWLRSEQNVQMLGERKADKDVPYISSSNLNKNNCDDQKIFSLPGLVLIEYSYFYYFLKASNKPCFHSSDRLNVSDMDLNPFLMLI